MPSIQFDGTQIVGADYYPQFVKHETAPDRQVSSLSPVREDGEVVVSERYSKKVITLQGVITESTQALFEAQIDTMKELFSRPERTLDIDWNGSTRRYVATCTAHTFDRDHFNTLFCKWTAEFTVFSGEGKDTAATTALNAHPLTITTPATDSFTMNGSKPAKALITLTGEHTAGMALGVEYKDVDTGDKIVITNAAGLGFGGLDTIIIDCLLKKVTANFGNSNFSIKPFYGMFPKFKIGTNNVKISVGNLVNQTSSDPDFTTGANGAAGIDGTIKQAQSFMVPYTDGTFQSVILSLNKSGSPTSTIMARIETDNNDAPSGSLVSSNASGTFAASSITAANESVTVNFTGPFTLQANTRYWLVVQSNGSGDDGSNRVNWIFDNLGDYQNGVAMSYNPTWAAASQPTFRFKILYGGLDGYSATIYHTVSYYATYL